MVEDGKVQLLCGLAGYGKMFGLHAGCSELIWVGFPLFSRSSQLVVTAQVTVMRKILKPFSSIGKGSVMS